MPYGFFSSLPIGSKRVSHWPFLEVFLLLVMWLSRHRVLVAASLDAVESSCSGALRGLRYSGAPLFFSACPPSETSVVSSHLVFSQRPPCSTHRRTLQEAPSPKKFLGKLLVFFFFFSGVASFFLHRKQWRTLADRVALIFSYLTRPFSFLSPSNSADLYHLSFARDPIPREISAPFFPQEFPARFKQASGYPSYELFGFLAHA